MGPENFTRSVVALACWRAAKSETYQVMLSVLMVFKNNAEAYQKDLYEVCSQWLELNPNEDFPDPRDPNFLNMLSRLEGVASGFVPDKTDGALAFSPKSSEHKITGQITCSMGQMNFIR